MKVRRCFCRQTGCLSTESLGYRSCVLTSTYHTSGVDGAMKCIPGRSQASPLPPSFGINRLLRRGEWISCAHPARCSCAPQKRQFSCYLPVTRAPFPALRRSARQPHRHLSSVASRVLYGHPRRLPHLPEHHSPTMPHTASTASTMPAVSPALSPSDSHWPPASR
jgi:hypothetical protein